MKVMLMVALLLFSTGVSRAQGLQDEDKALQNLNPANDLNIPPEICSMDVVMLRTRTSFCHLTKCGRKSKNMVGSRKHTEFQQANYPRQSRGTASSLQTPKYRPAKITSRHPPGGYVAKLL